MMDFAGLKAVVTDDCRHTLAFVAEMARLMGFEVESFDRAVDALHFIRNNGIDIVFTDFRMPEMDGVTFAGEIRKLNRDVPIVMITSDGDYQPLRDKAFETGVTDILKKPVSYQGLNHRLKKLFIGRQDASKGGILPDR
jgi:DNA-binding NtrC family response regulator